MSRLAAPLQTAFWRRMVIGYHGVLMAPEAAYQRTVQLVQVTYAAWAYFALTAVRSAPSWSASPPADLLWPSAWMTALPWTTAVVVVVVLFAGGTLAAAVAPRSQLARVAALLGILAAQGLKYSYDKVNHSYHLWVLAALLLVFLPRGDEDDDGFRRSYLEVAWGIQATILATYTLAGLQKVWGAAQDLVEDGHTLFSLDSLALHVAKTQLRGLDDGVLGPLVVDNPSFGGPLMVGALVLELSALTLLFRPRMQRWFGVGAIVLHVGIGLVMDVWFEAQVLVVAIWLIGTPFALGRGSAFATAHELPWIGPAVAARLAPRSPRGTLTVYLDPDASTPAVVPAEAATADVAELGLPPEVRYAVRHEVGGASVLLAGRRARAWADHHADDRHRRSVLRLLRPALLWPPSTVGG